jgi:hypothetical protein
MDIKTKIFNSRRWRLIFRHKYETDADLFTSESEVLSCNSKKKFSILGTIDESFRSNGVYEFLLEYPEVEGFNHWTQTKNPVTCQPNTENGYKGIHISWSSWYWHGLSRSSTSSTFIDGSPFHGTFYYAIGLYKNWCDAIPAFVNNYDPNYVKTCEVLLWIRISGNECTCIIRRDSIVPLISLTSLLFLS